MRKRHDYVAFEYKFFTSPEVLDLGRELAFRLATSIAWCHGNKTDGFIKTSAGKELVPRKGDRDRLERHWWAPVRGGWQVRDYLEHQPSKSEMKKWSEAGKTARAYRRGDGARQTQLIGLPEHPQRIVERIVDDSLTNGARTVDRSLTYQDQDQDLRTQTDRSRTSSSSTGDADRSRDRGRRGGVHRLGETVEFRSMSARVDRALAGVS